MSENKNQNVNFSDIQANTDKGPVRRAVSRYLFPRNYEASIERHEAWGSGLVRKLIMNTYGKKIPATPNGMYRLDPTKPKLDAAMEYAVKGSVVSEASHTAGLAGGIAGLALEISQNDVGSGVILPAAVVAVNGALVAVQRYNRARMTKRIDEELAAGQSFEPGYENWLGLDAQAQVTAESQQEQELNHSIGSVALVGIGEPVFAEKLVV